MTARGTEIPTAFRGAAELLDRGAADGTYTAGVLLASRGEEILLSAAAGEAYPSSIFDVASLTKPLVAALFFALCQEGILAPETALADVLPPGLPDPAAGGIRFLHLLTHTAGLPAYLPFYEEILAREASEGKRLFGTSEGHDLIVEAVRRTPLAYPPGTSWIYSDLGYILLGRAIELAAFGSLDRLFASRVAGPLRMMDTGYLPLARMSECETGRIVTTGHSDVRGREKIGEVDDENCAAMGGVAGHAGIFSTACDLHRLALELLRALRGEGRLLTRESAARMTARAPSPPGCPRTPGWDTPTAGAGGVSQAGTLFSERTVGHLGFTGCSLWLDLEREACVVFLTNRVHRKQNEGLKVLRPSIHDAVMRGLAA